MTRIQAASQLILATWLTAGSSGSRSIYHMLVTLATPHWAAEQANEIRSVATRCGIGDYDQRRQAATRPSPPSRATEAGARQLGGAGLAIARSTTAACSPGRNGRRRLPRRTRSSAQAAGDPDTTARPITGTGSTRSSASWPRRA